MLIARLKFSLNEIFSEFKVNTLKIIFCLSGVLQ